MDDNFSIKSEELEDVQFLENDSFQNFPGYYDRNDDENSKNRDLYQLLKSWNLLQLYDHFENEQIDLEVLSVIKPHFFERLLAPFNLRTHIMFEHNLQQWRETIGHPLPKYPETPYGSFNYRSNSSPRPSQQIRPSYPRRPVYPSSSFRERLPAKPLETVTSVPLTNLISNPPQPPTPEPTTTQSIENTVFRQYPTLDSILARSLKGQMLLKIYEKHERFEDPQRTLLIQLIAEHFTDNSIHFELATSYAMERQILEKFPTEQLGFYRTSKRGRIYNKYCNYKYALQKVTRNKAKKRTRSSSSEEQQTVELIPEEDAEEHIKNLSCADLTSAKIEYFWTACTRYRIADVRKMDSVNLILNKWPQYKLSNGHKFIAMDFKYLHSNWDALLTNWDPTFDRLSKFLNFGQNIKSPDIKSVLASLEGKLSKDCRDAGLLWCLHGYLKPSCKYYAMNEKGKKCVSSISIKESQSSLTFVAKTERDIDVHRQNFQQQHNDSHIYPFIAVIGDSILKFSKILVCLEDVKYECDSFIGALNLCYNIIFVFKMEYPTGCKAVWSFIENNFFDTKSESRYARVHMLINALKSKNQDFSDYKLDMI